MYKLDKSICRYGKSILMESKTDGSGKFSFYSGEIESTLCDHKFNLEQLQLYFNKVKTREDLPCPECNKELSIHDVSTRHVLWSSGYVPLLNAKEKKKRKQEETETQKQGKQKLEDMLFGLEGRELEVMLINIIKTLAIPNKENASALFNLRLTNKKFNQFLDSYTTNQLFSKTLFGIQKPINYYQLIKWEGTDDNTEKNLRLYSHKLTLFKHWYKFLYFYYKYVYKRIKREKSIISLPDFTIYDGSQPKEIDVYVIPKCMCMVSPKDEEPLIYRVMKQHWGSQFILVNEQEECKGLKPATKVEVGFPLSCIHSDFEFLKGMIERVAIEHLNMKLDCLQIPKWYLFKIKTLELQINPGTKKLSNLLPDKHNLNLLSIAFTAENRSNTIDANELAKMGVTVNAFTASKMAATPMHKLIGNGDCRSIAIRNFDIETSVEWESDIRDIFSLNNIEYFPEFALELQSDSQSIIEMRLHNVTFGLLLLKMGFFSQEWNSLIANNIKAKNLVLLITMQTEAILEYDNIFNSAAFTYQPFKKENWSGVQQLFVQFKNTPTEEIFPENTIFIGADWEWWNQKNDNDFNKRAGGDYFDKRHIRAPGVGFFGTIFEVETRKRLNPYKF